MSWYEELIKTVVVAVISAGLWQEIVKRRWAKQDSKKNDERESGAAQIVDRQLMVNELWAKVRELDQAERAMINERIALSKQIFELEGEKQSLTRLTVEQEKEIASLRKQLDGPGKKQ